MAFAKKLPANELEELERLDVYARKNFDRKTYEAFVFIKEGIAANRSSDPKYNDDVLSLREIVESKGKARETLLFVAMYFHNTGDLHFPLGTLSSRDISRKTVSLAHKVAINLDAPTYWPSLYRIVKLCENKNADQIFERLHHTQTTYHPAIVDQLLFFPDLSVMDTTTYSRIVRLLDYSLKKYHDITSPSLYARFYKGILTGSDIDYKWFDLAYDTHFHEGLYSSQEERNMCFSILRMLASDGNSLDYIPLIDLKRLLLMTEQAGIMPEHFDDVIRLAVAKLDVYMRSHPNINESPKQVRIDAFVFATRIVSLLDYGQIDSFIQYYMKNEYESLAIETITEEIVLMFAKLETVLKDQPHTLFFDLIERLSSEGAKDKLDDIAKKFHAEFKHLKDAEKALNAAYAHVILGEEKKTYLETVCGIEYFIRYSLNALEDTYNIMKTRRAEKEIAFAMYAKADHNKAFYHDTALQTLYEGEYSLVITEAGNQDEFKDRLMGIRQIGPVGVFILGGHGSPDKIRLGYTENDEDTIDLTDADVLRELQGIIIPKGAAILQACSAGKGKNSIASLFSTELDVATFAATRDTNISKVILDAQGKIKDVKYIQGKTAEFLKGKPKKLR